MYFLFVLVAMRIRRRAVLNKRNNSDRHHLLCHRLRLRMVLLRCPMLPLLQKIFEETLATRRIRLDYNLCTKIDPYLTETTK